MADYRRLTPAQEALFDGDGTLIWSRGSNFQTYSGTDIKAAIYLPLVTKSSLAGSETVKFKIFADLQTISISSTRSVSPIRVLGRSSPLGYTRGARTFAGSLIFATIRKDPFNDIVDSGVNESFVNASTSIVADQMPPFSVVITATTELGAAAIQIINGITITNYGTTYSVDDMYTETTYTYVATDVTPLVEADLVRSKNPLTQKVDNKLAQTSFRSITDLVTDSMGRAYGQIVDISRKAGELLASKTNRSEIR